MKKMLFFLFSLFSINSYAEFVDIKMTGSQGDHYFFTVPRSHSSNKEYLLDRAQTFCYDKTFCYVHFWQAGEASPIKFPLTDKEVRFELAQYTQNKITGLSRIIYNCKRFPGTNERECFSP